MSGNNEKMVLVRPGPQKKSEDHQSKYEFNSTWAERIASLIVVGLAVEIAAVFIFQKPFREGALTILANMLIVAGVWGELIFARRAKEASDQIVAAAHTRAAEAMEGAVFAIKEARQRAEPRQVDREKFNEWIAMGATAKAEVVYVRECPDCAWLAFSIAAMLKGANWDVSPLSPQPINPALGKEHCRRRRRRAGCGME